MGSNWSFTGHPDPLLEAAFAPVPTVQPSWLGADSSTSLRLNSTHHLWLWADTYWGQLVDGVRTFSAMPHNTLALTPSGPRPSPVFYGRTDGDGASASRPLSFFSPSDATDGSFYWMVAGAVLPTSKALVAFAQRQGPGGLGHFEGSDVVLVRNYSDPDPQRWRYETSRIGASDAAHMWNVGVFADEGDGFVYLVGCVEESYLGHNRTQQLARISEANLLAFEWDGLTFWGGAAVGWVVRPWDAAPLYAGPYTEGSLFKHPLGFYYVVGLQAGMADVMIYSAASLTGPWGGALAYALPPLGANDVAYAAKAHPELAQAEDEIVISYNINCLDGASGGASDAREEPGGRPTAANDPQLARRWRGALGGRQHPGDCLDGNLSIYVPRFVRLKVSPNGTARAAWEGHYMHAAKGRVHERQS